MNFLYSDNETYISTTNSSISDSISDSNSEETQILRKDTEFFVKTKKGIQDTMRSREVKKEIEDYYVIKTMNEKRILKKLKLYKNWIKYINTETFKFRFGGLLYKVNYPDYIMLMNPTNRQIWMVRLDKNILFIKNIEKN
jgi:hypothetical protein